MLNIFYRDLLVFSENLVDKLISLLAELFLWQLSGGGFENALITFIYVLLAIVLTLVFIAVVNYFFFVLSIKDLQESKGNESLTLFVKNIKAPVLSLLLAVLILDAFSALLSFHRQDLDLSFISTFQLIFFNCAIVWVAWNYISHFERKVTAQSKEQNKTRFLGGRFDRDTILRGFLFMRMGLLVVLALMVMQQLGVSVASILAIGGFGGIVIGYAAKDFTSNMLAGLRIFSARHFEVGDWILCPAENIEGVVEEIGWQVTMIRTFDKRPMFVPNSKLVDNMIENPQRMTNRRIFEYFNLRYDDMDKMPAVLKDVRQMLADHDEIDQNQIIMVNLDRFGDYSIDFFIYCMTSTTDWAHYHKVKESVLLSVADIVLQAGADFAFPTSTVQVSDKGEVADEALRATVAKRNVAASAAGGSESIAKTLGKSG